jgi:hypothetical protein
MIFHKLGKRIVLINFAIIIFKKLVFNKKIKIYEKTMGFIKENFI